MEKKLIPLLAINSVLAVMLFLVNYLYLRSLEIVYPIVNLLCVMLVAMPIIIIRYAGYAKKRTIETMFPVFLHDFTETVRGGLSITEALKVVSKNDYKELTTYVKKMAAQLDWGIPLEDVLIKFDKSVKSDLINRVIFSVIETHKFGGKLTDTLDALSNIVVQVDRLREERKTYLHSQLITGYVVFFVFLIVVVGLERFLFPTLTGQSGKGAAEAIKSTSEFRSIFMNLILIQGFFSGLTIGKMAEGVTIAGIKHSLILMFVGGIVFGLFG